MMSLFLLVHDGKRLLKFFFTNEFVNLPVIQPPIVKNNWLRITKVCIKVLLIGNALIYGAIQAVANSKKYGDDAPKTTLYGVYNVDKFIFSNDTLQPLTTDTVRWRQLVIQWEGVASVRLMNDSISRYFVKLDSTLHTIEMQLRDDTLRKHSFHYQIPDPNQLILKGVSNNDSLIVLFNKNKDDLKNFRLTKRGFHWINEYPYNR